MNPRTLRPLVLCTTALLFACDPALSDDGGSTTTATPDDTSAGSTSATTGMDSDSADGSGSDSADDSTGMPVDDTGNGDLSWMELSGPCGGSATNAMWFDDPNTGFVGCGENAAGEGLYTTVDGGATWESHNAFNEVRIMDLRRGPDGVLYGAGTDQLDGYSLWSIDESGANLAVTGLYTPSNSAFTAVGQGENAAVTAGGQILVDSLTGTSAAYRAAAGGMFEEQYNIGEAAIDDPDVGPAFQVRRIVTLDGDFYAAGSLINDPARVHLPSQMPGATFHFHTVLLQQDTRDGELLDMHVWSPTRMIVAGHDQSLRFPLIYVIDGGDPYVSDNWQQVVLADSGIEYEGGINDLHVVGDTVVAVGEKYPTSSGGFVIMSEDGGLTWTEITPEAGVGAMSAVALFDNGEIVAAGGSGELWRYGAG